MKILWSLPSRFWFVWLPLLLLGIQLVIEFTVSPQTHARLHTENSPIETLQFILLALSFGLALRLLLALKFRPPLWPSLWVLIAALGCFYIAGEEISWGQHIVRWSTPEYWAAINDQNETNLHNTSSWLDQKPRLLLELGVIVGGLLLPLYRRFSRKGIPVWLGSIAPDERLMVVACLFLFIKLADKLHAAGLPHLFLRPSEVVEFYIYYFVFLYLCGLKRRWASEGSGS